MVGRQRAWVLVDENLTLRLGECLDLGVIGEYETIKLHLDGMVSA